MKTTLPATEGNKDIVNEYIAYVLTSLRNVSIDIVEQEAKAEILIPDYETLKSPDLIYYDREYTEKTLILAREYQFEIENALLAEAVLLLSEENRYLIKRSFWDEIKDRELAKEFGLNNAAFRKRKSRIIQNIRNYMEENKHGE